MIADPSPPSKAPNLRPPSRRALPPFAALHAFDAVGRLGGVRNAAEYLCRDYAVIGRHVGTIEKWTGAKLFDRGPGGPVLTEDGVRFHRAIAHAMDSIAAAAADLRRGNDTRRLRIQCTPGFALHWLSGRLGDLEKSLPEAEVEVRPADRSPEYLSHDADVEIQLIAEYGPPVHVPARLKVMEIARVPIIAVASPGYLARTPAICEPRDLLAHQILHEEAFDRWRSWLAAHGVTEELALTGPRLWQGHLTVDAARHGRGIALTNQLIVDDDLAAGRLIEIGRDAAEFLPQAMAAYQLIARADCWDRAPVHGLRGWLSATIALTHPHLCSSRTESRVSGAALTGGASRPAASGPDSVRPDRNRI